jgi:hypothetical protein
MRITWDSGLSSAWQEAGAATWPTLSSFQGGPGLTTSSSEGNAEKLGELPPGTRLGTNANAFIGGFRPGRDQLIDRKSAGHKGTAVFGGPPRACLGRKR